MLEDLQGVRSWEFLGSLTVDLSNFFNKTESNDRFLQIADQARLINLTNHAATVDFEILPYVDYAFKDNTALSAVTGTISVTDSVGVKSGVLRELSTEGNLDNGRTIFANVIYKAFWNGANWCLSTSRIMLLTSDLNNDSVSYGASAKMVQNLRQNIAENYVLKEANKGLMNTADQAKFDFVGSVTPASQSLTGVQVTKNVVCVSAGTNQTLSIGSVAVNDAAFIIHFTASAAITVAIPNTGIYQSKADALYTLASGDIILIHGVYISAKGVYSLNVEK